MSETQSVCKHCQQKLELFAGLWKHVNFNASSHGHVAEPASTGEPPPTERFFRGDGVEEKVIYQPVTFAAVRPSEPSAPQTSAERLKKCVKEGPDCDCVTVCKFDPPQPVSGDAPDFDAIARDFLRSDEWRAAPLCGAWEERLLAGLLKKLAGEAPKVEEIARQIAAIGSETAWLSKGPRSKEWFIEQTALYLSLDLRPYFPPTSTVRKSPDSHLGAVRD